MHLDAVINHLADGRTVLYADDLLVHVSDHGVAQQGRVAASEHRVPGWNR